MEEYLPLLHFQITMWTSTLVIVLAVAMVVRYTFEVFRSKRRISLFDRRVCAHLDSQRHTDRQIDKQIDRQAHDTIHAFCLTQNTQNTHRANKCQIECYVINWQVFLFFFASISHRK